MAKEKGGGLGGSATKTGSTVSSKPQPKPQTTTYDPLARYRDEVKKYGESGVVLPPEPIKVQAPAAPAPAPAATPPPAPVVNNTPGGIPTIAAAFAAASQPSAQQVAIQAAADAAKAQKLAADAAAALAAEQQRIAAAKSARPNTNWGSPYVAPVVAPRPQAPTVQAPTVSQPANKPNNWWDRIQETFVPAPAQIPPIINNVKAVASEVIPALRAMFANTGGGGGSGAGYMPPVNTPAAQWGTPPAPVGTPTPPSYNPAPVATRTPLEAYQNMGGALPAIMPGATPVAPNYPTPTPRPTPTPPLEAYQGMPGPYVPLVTSDQRSVPVQQAPTQLPANNSWVWNDFPQLGTPAMPPPAEPRAALPAESSWMWSDFPNEQEMYSPERRDAMRVINVPRQANGLAQIIPGYGNNYPVDADFPVPMDTQQTTRANMVGPALGSWVANAINMMNSGQPLAGNTPPLVIPQVPTTPNPSMLMAMPPTQPVMVPVQQSQATQPGTIINPTDNQGGPGSRTGGSAPTTQQPTTTPPIMPPISWTDAERRAVERDAIGGPEGELFERRYSPKGNKETNDQYAIRIMRAISPELYEGIDDKGMMSELDIIKKLPASVLIQAGYPGDFARQYGSKTETAKTEAAKATTPAAGTTGAPGTGTDTAPKASTGGGGGGGGGGGSGGTTAPAVVGEFPDVPQWYQNAFTGAIGDFATHYADTGINGGTKQALTDFQTFITVWSVKTGRYPTVEEASKIFAQYRIYLSNLGRKATFQDFLKFLNRYFAKAPAAPDISYLNLGEM